MSETPFTGRVTQMKPASKFLAAEDLAGLGEVEMTIEGVYQFAEEIMQDGKKKDGFSIGFIKSTKKLIVNATNRKVLAMSFGADTTKWAGNKIKLFVQDGIRNPNGGATVSGIRIKTHLTPSK